MFKFEILKKILTESLKGVDDKFSSKKLTLFVFVLMFLSLHITYLIVSYQTKNFQDFGYVVLIEISFIASLIGLNGFLNFLHFKEKLKNDFGESSKNEQKTNSENENKNQVLLS